MTWRGTATAQDRFWSCLSYLLVLIKVLFLALTLMVRYNPTLIDIISQVLLPLVLLMQIYQSIPFGGLLILILLLVLVVRNARVSHFIRFNTMQAILLGIALYLGQVILSLLSFAPGSSPLFISFHNILLSVLTLGVLASVLYSIVQSARGIYADIPTVSKAAHLQVQ